MELFSAPWWSALMAIILIDLVLAGDNAIVIALAARNLPAQLQKKAIIWGTVGAIGVRAVMTVGVVWLLQVPGLMLVGGLGLVWIAYKLLADQGGSEHEAPVVSTFWGAMKTIVVADALMGVDNVLGVAGAAHGAFELVIIGLLICVPIVVFGSSVVLKLVERFPAIIQIGAAVFGRAGPSNTLSSMGSLMIILAAVTASTAAPIWMMAGKRSTSLSTTELPNTAARWGTYLVTVVAVLGGGRWATQRAATRT
ncbi:MAG: TerC family protein [Burkholderiales bacterium]|nr:TerC family protein [Burkholderiales bacterium]